jgi:hypothetical protein
VATSSVLVGTRRRLVDARKSWSWAPVMESSGLPQVFCHRSLGSKIELLASLDFADDIDCLTLSVLLPVSTSLRSQSDFSAEIAGKRYRGTSDSCDA